MSWWEKKLSFVLENFLFRENCTTGYFYFKDLFSRQIVITDVCGHRSWRSKVKQVWLSEVCKTPWCVSKPHRQTSILFSFFSRYEAEVLNISYLEVLLKIPALAAFSKAPRIEPCDRLGLSGPARHPSRHLPQCRLISATLPTPQIDLTTDLGATAAQRGGRPSVTVGPETLGCKGSNPLPCTPHPLPGPISFP